MPYVLHQVQAHNLKKYGQLTCEICGEAIVDESFQYDHIIPVSRFDRELASGRMNSIRNLQIAHRSCNAKKSNSLPEN